MKQQENKKKQENKVDKEKHFERLEILRRVKDPKEEQLTANFDTGSFEIRDSLKEVLNKSFEDLETKHNLYYTKIREVLMQYLPKGKEYDKERNIIYDEKNIFLNRGKAKNKAGIRGSDGRISRLNC